ncbi:MAG: FAD-binding oxidoreductase [Rhodospirillales bacterium]|nr:FAD-binding oxidoreductase [Rhodospirillales bacterium]
MHAFDVVVIGAGIAGATAAAALARNPATGDPSGMRIALVEAEDAAGYHSTGRSAAIWILNYGPPDVRVLTGLSRDFFDHPPPGFCDAPLGSPRPMLLLAPPDQLQALGVMLNEGLGLKEIGLDRVREMVPALRPGYAAAAAIEEDAFDMDVAALHQGFLRQLRAAGGVLALRHRAGRIAREAGQWSIETSGGDVFRAPVIVNAAGAWGDVVAEHAGLRRIGLQPCRRTGAIIDPAPYIPTDWPMINEVAHTWYVRPEARTKLMVSPADETPMEPHDVQPDELDIAIAIDRMQQALDIEVRRVEHSWAGLRSFTPDRNLAFGPDPDAPDFYWFIGQGGYGIQTSPAAGALIAAMITGRDPGPAGRILANIDPGRFRKPA